MQKRFVKLVNAVADPRCPWSDMQARTGISRLRWRGAYRGTQRINDEMIEALAKHWPEYMCWLVAGEEGVVIKQKSLE